MLDGMEIDAAPEVRMPALDDLLDYCRKVAGSVGVLSVHVFGVPRDPGPRIAVELGNALQLTNILRDLEEDAELHRVYVPQEMLDRHGIAAPTPSALLAHPRFAEVCAELAGLARGYYAESSRLLTELGWRRMRPAVLMMAVYRETLDRLENARLESNRRSDSGDAGPQAVARSAVRTSLTAFPGASDPRHRRRRGRSCRRRFAGARWSSRDRPRSGRPGRRSLPVVSRFEARSPCRQRQPSAPERQPVRHALPRGNRERRTPSSAPPRPAFRSSTFEADVDGRCGPTRDGCPGGSFAPIDAFPTPGHGATSPRCDSRWPVPTAR